MARPVDRRFRRPASVPCAPLARWADTIVTSHTVYVIVLDVAAGRRHRYTVHAISRRGMQVADVIGRELPLVNARHAVNEHDARMEGRRP